LNRAGWRTVAARCFVTPHFFRIIMKIGILGVGHIGKTLSRKLSAAGHDVQVANSRGPETIDSEVLAFGARAVDAADVARGVEVLILSVPLNRMPATASLMASLPADTVVIDTSNYYPARDDRIQAIDAGQVESEWVVEQLKRPVAKAWNAIGSDSLARKGSAPGTPGRIAIPVAADRDRDLAVTLSLIEDTGFDAVNAGSLADSWRQQPGAPGYCTDLTREELVQALGAAERSRLPQRRDLAFAAISERFAGVGTNPDADYAVRLGRALYM
jgi:predicted dinucleotide-binding enzyme